MKKATIIVRGTELDINYDSFDEDENVVTVLNAFCGNTDIIDLIDENGDVMDDIRDELSNLEIIKEEEDY